MRGPPPAGWLLDAAELGRRLHPIDRALAALQTADPSVGDPASLPIAERDRRLFELRRAAFGDAMPCVADCPACGSTMEFELSAAALLEGFEREPAAETIEAEGWTIALRPLDSRDLARAARAGDPAGVESILVAGAMSIMGRPDEAKQGDDPPEGVRAAAAARLEEREARAEVALDLTCDACGARWTDGFDIGAHLGDEIAVAASWLIAEIAALARRFGWSEAEILAMPAARRRAYLAEAVR